MSGYCVILGMSCMFNNFYNEVLNAILPLLPSYWGVSFALGCQVSIFGGIHHSAVDGCSAASCGP